MPDKLEILDVLAEDDREAPQDAEGAVITPGQALTNLHPRNDETPNRDLVLLVEEDDAVRRLVKRLLSRELPSFRIESYSSHDAALTALNGAALTAEATNDSGEAAADTISKDISTQVALIIANIGLGDIGLNFARSVWSLARTDTGLQRVPVILTTGLRFDPEFSLSTQVTGLLDEGMADSVVYKPFKPHDLGASIVRATQNRATGFAETQKRALREIVQNYTTYYLGLLENWKKILTPFIYKDEMIQDVLTSIDQAIDLLNKLATPDGLEKNVGRSIFHDLNNKLAVVMACVGLFTEEDGNLCEASNDLIPTVTQFVEDTKRIQAIYQGRALATDYKPANQGEKIKIQKLTDVEGLVFFIVDDNHGVIGRSMTDIGRAGANSFAVDTPDSLSETLEGENRLNVDVILLDHQFVPGKNPGDAPNVAGYTLIDELRQAYPNALIVAHTADTEALNADPNNPYKAASVEIIGKGEWNALSGIVRKWRLAKAEAVQRSEVD